MTEIIYGNLRLLGDRLLLKPLDWQGEAVHGNGARLHVVRSGRALRGRVVAVGPGHHPIKYKPSALGKKAKMDYAKRFQPTEVKPGDIVELGGLNVFDGKGYQFMEVLYNGENHIICSERDVCIVVEDEMPLIGFTRKISREEALKLWPIPSHAQAICSDSPDGR